MKKTIKRSLLFSLKDANKNKIEFLESLFIEYQKMLQYFIDLGWKEKRLLKYEDVKKCSLNSFLSRRYMGNTLINAQLILKSLKNKKRKSKPSFNQKSMKLDGRFFKLEKSENSFDYWLLIRDSKNKIWINFPIKNYNYAREKYSNWKIKNFVELLYKNNKWFAKFVWEKEIEIQEKEPIGVDIGYNKLAVDSNNRIFGKQIKKIIEKIDNKKYGSKNWKQYKHFLKTEINKELKKLVDGQYSIVLEDLKYLKYKTKKLKKLNKSVRRKFNYWIYSYILKRIKELCEVVGVQYHIISPKNTSRTCPRCGYVDKSNRCKEKFICLHCGYSADADFVGATNILLKFTTKDFSVDFKGVYSPLVC